MNESDEDWRGDMQKNNKQMWYGLFGFQMMIIVMFLWFGLNDNIKLSAICGDSIFQSRNESERRVLNLSKRTLF